MKTLSNQQAKVFFAIKKHGPIGPTALGCVPEISYESASGMVNRQLKHLVKEGLIIREAVNQRRVMYRVADAAATVPPFRIISDISGIHRDQVASYEDATIANA